MWMMGCRDGSDLNTSDSFNSRKLRPLIPRPTSSSPSSTTSTTTTTSSPTLSRIHAHDLLSLNTHLGAIEQGKRELSTQPVSSRWNPTPEQLRTLEDLYRRGTRTPTAEQIQYITAQLRRYGKIEGKNVFYWFQNHKARERQKRKRRIEVAAAAAEHDAESSERKDSVEMSTKGFEAEGWKSWDSPTDCSTIVEESAPMGRPDSGRDAWLPCSQEFQIQSSADWHATWQMVHLSSLPHLLNTCSTIQLSDTTTITTTVASTADTNSITVNEDSDLDDQSGSSKTLQLFPPRSDGIDGGEKGPTPMPTTAATDLGSYQFFQFLPLKN